MRSSLAAHKRAFRQNQTAQSSSSEVLDERGGTKRAFRQARKSGNLSIPAKGLTEFPEEVCHLMDFLESDEKGWECVDLLKIDMSHNEIKTIPSTINLLTGLLSFKMCQNKINSIPNELFELTTMSYLDLSNNCLVGDFPSALGNLHGLKELSLAGNKLTSLPETIGALEKLQKLTAQLNQLETIPLTFSNLRQIAMLDLSKNKLTSLNGCLKNNVSLKFLDLRQNRLTTFPELPFEGSLDTLYLGFNQLTSINDESLIRAQKNLTVLDLRDNKLSSISDAVCFLQRLKTLDLTNNDLSDLPPGLGYLTQLNHILTDGNTMRSIRRAVLSSGCEPLKKYLRTRGKPPSGVDAVDEEMDEFSEPVNDNFTIIIRDATASGTLELVEMRLQTIPKEIWSKSTLIEKLTVLNLSKNGLQELPEEISWCVHLHTLIVEENSLERIPDSFSQLCQLQYLRLRKNSLVDSAFDTIFTPSSPIISRLKELDLRNNSLQSVPHGLVHLSALDTLLLSFNRISTLEGFDWRKMRKLSILSVADNKLNSIGNIFLLPALTSLSIENNGLMQIPSELGLMKSLKSLYMNGNPQRTVRIATLNKGTEEILVYLKNRLTPSEIEAIEFQQREYIPESPLKNKPTAVPAPAAVTPTLPARQGMKTPPAQTRREPPTAVPAPAQQTPPPSEETKSILMYQIEETISRLESQLENDSALSAAKRFALKKELAKARAEKIRESRRM